MIKWMNYRSVYFGISFTLLILSLIGFLKWGLKLGVDFTGGAVVEYKIKKDISTEKVGRDLSEKGFSVTSIQKAGEDSYLFKFPPMQREEKDQTTLVLKEIVDGGVEELKFENIGPSIGPELVNKTVTAIIVSTGAILLWIAIQFKSFKFGTSAVLAMLHDSLILTGVFSFLGYFFDAEVDFLFVTALLTTLSFSVHDTIVVYDRIREILKKESGEIKDLGDIAISETMVRSLNNSFTIIFMLIALILMGGSTIKWFAIALLIGTVLGTYSSPFVAVSLLVSWDDFFMMIKKRNLFKFLKFRK